LVFEPGVREGYEWINAVDDDDYDKFLSFDGASKIDDWKPVRVRRVACLAGKIGFASDFPWLGCHALVLGEAAVKALGQMVQTCAEILPLEVVNGPSAWVLNILKVMDALDEEKSEVQRFQSSNRIMRIVRHSFKADVIKDQDLFRLPYQGSVTYVSRRFVDAVTAAGLVGLEFHRVWAPSASVTTITK
jgi:hypothetical protein